MREYECDLRVPTHINTTLQMRRCLMLRSLRYLVYRWSLMWRFHQYDIFSTTIIGSNLSWKKVIAWRGPLLYSFQEVHYFIPEIIRFNFLFETFVIVILVINTLDFLIDLYIRKDIFPSKSPWRSLQCIEHPICNLCTSSDNPCANLFKKFQILYTRLAHHLFS